jgi:hypothetical protein
MKPTILIACEESGAVRRAFARLGCDVWSCDLQPARDGSDTHITGDVSGLLNEGWDMIIAFPPCTYLCASGARWRVGNPERQAKTLAAIEFVKAIYNAAPLVAIENPVGRLSTAWRKPDQYVQPWMFGEGYTKKTGLWLKGLPLLQPTNVVPVTMPGHIHRQSPGPERARIRSLTPEGLATAMADQWSKAL